MKITIKRQVEDFSIEVSVDGVEGDIVSNVDLLRELVSGKSSKERQWESVEDIVEKDYPARDASEDKSANFTVNNIVR